MDGLAPALEEGRELDCGVVPGDLHDLGLVDGALNAGDPDVADRAEVAAVQGAPGPFHVVAHAYRVLHSGSGTGRPRDVLVP